MYRASPPRFITALAKTTVGSAESMPATSAFINLERSTVTHDGGYAAGEYALLPDKAQYDMIRIGFGQVTLAGTNPAFTLQVWGVGSEDVPYLLGTSVLSADGTFPAVEFENHQNRITVIVASVGGTNTPTVSVTPFVQGLYSLPYARG